MVLWSRWARDWWWKELGDCAEERQAGTNAGRRHVRQETRVLPLDTEDSVVDFRLRGGGAFGFLVHGMADGCKSCTMPLGALSGWTAAELLNSETCFAVGSWIAPRKHRETDMRS